MTVQRTKYLSPYSFCSAEIDGTPVMINRKFGIAGQADVPWYSVDICSEFTRKSPDSVRCRFTMACIGRQTMRTVTTDGREIQTFREGIWTKSVPPNGTLTTLLQIEPELVSFQLWSCWLCLTLLLGWSQVHTYWWFISARYRYWPDSV